MIVYHGWVKDDDFLREFMVFASPEPYELVLDVGSGTGVVAKTIQHFTGLVVGLDSSFPMLSKLTTRNICPVISDITSLPFRNDSFDMITARMVLHHVSDLGEAMKECYRVLKPEGRMIICEAVPPDYAVRGTYEKIFSLKEKRHTFYESDLINLLHYSGFEKIRLRPYYMKQVSLKNWLENSGLEKETCEKIIELHRDSDLHFKKVYNMTLREEDILIDWKFALVKGIK